MRNEPHLEPNLIDPLKTYKKMIPTAVHTEIQNRLRQAEREHNVRVVLAVESGSRAWGFASPNSDFDVRFIYVNPQEWYLSVGLEEQRDVIEYPIVDDIDINGWDIRKALRLFSKSNPAFVEWIQSPIVYKEFGDFAGRVRLLLSDVYSCESGIYHYRSMAKTNYRGYLQADRVRLKKYFYVLRPLLAVRWLERYGTAAPIEFEKLLHLIDEDQRLIAAIQDLLAQKRQSPELGLSEPIGCINGFIERELLRLEGVSPPRSRSEKVVPELTKVFQSALQESAFV